jgi:cytochrome c oxidase assembly protein subunit 15
MFLRRDSGPWVRMRPRDMALHRFTVFLAICTLFLVMAGASVTSNQAGLSVPDWPLSYGQVMPEMKGGVFYEHGHRMIASAVGFLTVILAIWLWRTEERKWLKALGWASLVAVIVQGVLGGMTVLFLLPKPVSIAHACLAQVFFCTTVAMALFTSPGWRRGPVPVEDQGWPSFRSLAIVTPVLVLLQIALGAGYRHRAFGILPHVIGAVIIGAIILMFAVFVLLQFPKHDALRRSALMLASITLVQVLLGIATYLARLNSLHAVTPDLAMIVSTIAHVGFGALTMAATVLLAIQVLRHVKSRTSEVVPGRVPAVS